MMAFEVTGGYQGASTLVRALAGRIPLATSLADVSTTLSYPAGTLCSAAKFSSRVSRLQEALWLSLMKGRSVVRLLWIRPFPRMEGSGSL